MKKKRILILIIVFVVVGILAYLIVNNFGKSGIASLEVTTNTQMEVLVDGKNVGMTPFTGTFQPNEVTVQIGNYETRVQLVNSIKTIVNRDFNEDKTQSYGEVVSFEATGLSTATVAIVTDPGGAQVKIDGNPYGFTPLNINGLKAGTHQLEVVASQYANKSFSINTVNGYKLIAAIDLQSQPLAGNAKPIQTETQKIITMVKILDTPNGFLRVRDQPTTSSDEIGQVKPGDKYTLISTDSSSGWYEIGLTATSSGWISNTYAATESGSVKD
ncbi:hypothetical protein BH10PAT1_BH10PAT1_3670 [soil metagenome]